MQLLQFPPSRRKWRAYFYPPPPPSRHLPIRKSDFSSSASLLHSSKATILLPLLDSSNRVSSLEKPHDINDRVVNARQLFPSSPSVNETEGGGNVVFDGRRNRSFRSATEWWRAIVPLFHPGHDCLLPYESRVERCVFPRKNGGQRVARVCPAIIRITSEPFNRRDNTFRGWLTEKSCDSTFVSIGPFFFFFFLFERR